ncbi:RecX family transcriptional regulator, partial [Candidatus Bipolaricaulota bacterium]|nr:RecX family transcriptional regulator [Candidatus Bipolaricaulota bacterium]
LLRYRPRSVAEARGRLEERGFPRAEVDAAVERALAEGLLDDRLFAKLWIEDRLYAHPLARRAIESELTDLGVDRALAQEQLGRLYPQEREKETAFRLASQRVGQLSLRHIEADKRRDRAVAFLARRGFTYTLARAAVTAAEQELEQDQDQDQDQDQALA